MPDVTCLGVRHHGPGSARRMMETLERLQPKAVLIEGPGDLSELLPSLRSMAMKPPVALLAYAVDMPENAVFWPFAAFSPEYQAARWALQNNAELRFIDLPAAVTLATSQAKMQQRGEASEENDSGDAKDKDITDEDGESEANGTDVERDPIGALAHAAGYDDGESWWSNVIEENPDSGAIFDAVAQAMSALRKGHKPPQREAQREAHMRLEIAATAKRTDGPIAVVCGAWHVPSLLQKTKLSEDRALLKGMPKIKIKATWAPWTSARLARATGYGAGVTAPGWYAHLWQHGTGARADALWTARIAATLREDGDTVSTASVIETVRLTQSLAVVRNRPSPGFEEMRDAAVACLMGGETLPWQMIEARLLLGNEVGTIPDNLPLAPLLEDLQRQQKRLRLKPEALERDLSIDLRSENGLARSTLLHRLLALDVPWGELSDPGRSRGTFREKWVIAWEPEYAVRLVEHLVYGPTIEAAASGRMTEAILKETGLSSLAENVRDALVAQLTAPAEEGINRLDRLAAHTDDCATLLATIPPIVDTLRYGTARDMALNRLDGLLRRLVVQTALSLPYAARNLDKEAAETLYGLIESADKAIVLGELDETETTPWKDALLEAANASQTTTLLAGLTARLAYEVEAMPADNVSTLMSRLLSPTRSATDAAGFFEGFFKGAGMRLVHDDGLRETVNAWVLSLDEESFTEYLPLFRRVFSTLDRNERRVLLERLLGMTQSGVSGLVLTPDAQMLWQAQLATLTAIFEGQDR